MEPFFLFRRNHFLFERHVDYSFSFLFRVVFREYREIDFFFSHFVQNPFFIRCWNIIFIFQSNNLLCKDCIGSSFRQFLFSSIVHSNYGLVDVIYHIHPIVLLTIGIDILLDISILGILKNKLHVIEVICYTFLPILFVITIFDSVPVNNAIFLNLRFLFHDNGMFFCVWNRISFADLLFFPWVHYYSVPIAIVSVYFAHLLILEYSTFLFIISKNIWIWNPFFF